MKLEEALAEIERLKIESVKWADRANENMIRAQTAEERLNMPETADFVQGVMIEAPHQVERWGEDHDRDKEPQDWFWTLGYLGGKVLAALKVGDAEKAKHHCISSAALMANWHAHISESGPMIAGLSAPAERMGEIAARKEQP